MEKTRIFCDQCETDISENEMNTCEKCKKQCCAEHETYKKLSMHDFEDDAILCSSCYATVKAEEDEKEKKRAEIMAIAGRYQMFVERMKPCPFCGGTICLGDEDFEKVEFECSGCDISFRISKYTNKDISLNTMKGIDLIEEIINIRN